MKRQAKLEIQIIDNKIAKHYLNIEQLQNRKANILISVKNGTFGIKTCTPHIKYDPIVFLTDLLYHKQKLSFAKTRQLLIVKYGIEAIPGITCIKDIYNKYNNSNSL